MGHSMYPKLDELGVKFTEVINAIRDLPMSEEAQEQAISIISSHYGTAIEVAKAVGKK